MNKTELYQRKKIVEKFNNQFEVGSIIEYKEGHFDNSDKNNIVWKDWKKYTLEKPAYLGSYSKIPLLIFKESRLIFLLANNTVKNFKI